jgi:hypothetical protein
MPNANLFVTCAKARFQIKFEQTKSYMAPIFYLIFILFEIFIGAGGCCVRDIIAIHQFTYHQFPYFTRRRGAIRERDEIHLFGNY